MGSATKTPGKRKTGKKASHSHGESKKPALSSYEITSNTNVYCLMPYPAGEPGADPCWSGGETNP